MLKAELLRPSALGPAEIAAWSAMLTASPHLQRGFFAPGFARACEVAHGRACVAVLHEGGTIRGFFPFQFRSRWHQRIGLAERIGGNLSDNAGLIAAPGLVVAPPTLLRLCRIGSFVIDHLVEEQTAHGLVADAWRIGHRIELADGSAAYFSALDARDRAFVRDTERRLRRAEREFGALSFTLDEHPGWPDAAALLAAKREQYHRTGVPDGFAVAERLRLIEALLAAPTPDCRPILTRFAAGERVLAQHLGLLSGGVLSYWFPVYDPEAHKVSPGRLLLWHTLHAAERLGLTLIDRGEGDSEAKRDFSTGTGRFGVAHWTAATWRGGAARLWQAVEWRLAAGAAARPRAPAT